MLNKLTLTILTAVLLTIAGATTSLAGPGNGNGGGGGGSSSSLTGDEVDNLLFMREEEKLARDTYWAMYDLWGLAIFDNISESEKSHMDALETLIDKYGLEDPIKGVGEFYDDNLQDLYNYLIGVGGGSETDGLKVGALIEETDIVDIYDAITVTSKTDIVSTYESLVCGSRNHLRSFISQIDNNGGSYEPQVLGIEVEGKDSDFWIAFWDIIGYEDFWALATSDMERDCGTNTETSNARYRNGNGKN